MNEDDKWRCYVCQPEPLQDLVAACEKVLRNLERMKKPKGDHDKPKRDSIKHKQDKVKNTALNGKDTNSDRSGMLTFSYKMLKVPKELVKKTKKLIETTNGLNSTFVQFIQQEPVYLGDNIVRHRHLKAFRSVLADLKKAHVTLEEALNNEFKDLEVQNGEGNGLANNLNVAKAVSNSEPAAQSREGQVILDGTTDQLPAGSVDCVDEETITLADVDMTEEAEPSSENPEDGFIDNEADADYSEPKCEDGGKASHDKDDMSVPAASEDHLDGEAIIPADVEMTEEAVPSSENPDDGFVDNEADAKLDSSEPECEDDGSAGGEASLDKDIVSVPPSVPEELFEMVESLSDCVKQEGEKDSLDSTDSTLSKTSPSDRKSGGSGKRSAKMNKKLIVKLTPIPLKITIKKEESKSQSKDKDSALSPDERRRSPRMKTTPLRKTSEKRTKSRSDSRKSNKDDCDSSQVPISADLSDSDSDEVPEILRQVEGMEDSSDEQKTAPKDGKRRSTSEPSEKSVKRQLSISSSSDEDGKSAKKQASKKKKKANESESSNHDSDLEKEIKSLSKLSSVRRSSKRGKKEEDESTKEADESKKEGKKGTKRSVDRKLRSQRGKDSASRESSSSDEEEEQVADSGEDSSDQQKIKPILESVMSNMDSFHQSSGQSAGNAQLVVGLGDMAKTYREHKALSAFV